MERFSARKFLKKMTQYTVCKTELLFSPFIAEQDMFFTQVDDMMDIMKIIVSQL